MSNSSELLRKPLPPGIELGIIRAEEEYLRDSFVQNATVINYEKGYISAPFVNQLVDLRLQGYAADIIAYNAKINHIPIDKVVQIPYSGNSLATSVAERLDKPLVLGRKESGNTPSSWERMLVINEKVKSFTTGATSSFVFNEIYPGDNVYLIDDVIANGDTASLIVKEFREYGVNVSGMSIYFAKLFQPGVMNICEKTGIEPFYVLGVENISEEGEIFLSAPRY